MIRVLIVEDDKNSQEYLQMLLKEYRQLEVIGSASDAEEATEMMVRHNPDLVFLDVELPGKTGFDVLREIKDRNVSSSVIFVTAYDKYAIEAIRCAAFDYLLKPLDPAEFRVAIDRFLSYSGNDFRKKMELLIESLGHQKKLQFNVRSGVIFLAPEEIMYCEADGNYVTIYLDDRKKEYVSCQLGHLLERVNGNDFIRIGRSLAINRQYITRLDRSKKTLMLEKGSITIQLSLSSRQMRELNTLL